MILLYSPADAHLFKDALNIVGKELMDDRHPEGWKLECYDDLPSGWRIKLDNDRRFLKLVKS